MAKRGDKRKAKKKAEKERKRKEVAKQKIENLRKSNHDTKEKSIELKDTLKGLQSDIREQIKNIDSSKEICKALQKFTFTVVTKRLDIPYLTEEIKGKFNGLHERITDTIKHISDIRAKFIETAVKIQDPGVLKADMESLQKYSEVLNGAQELMGMQSSLVDFGAECARFIRDLEAVIKECDKLREDHGDMALMPIATPEERKFLGITIDLETYEFKDKENKSVVDMNETSVPETIDTEVTELPKKSENDNDTSDISEEPVEEESESPSIEPRIIHNRPVINYDNNGKRIE